MTKYRKRAEFANFVCHFGNKDLLDYLEEIVIPAFTSGLERTYGEERMFFHDTKVINLKDEKDEPELAIAGRFVVDTKITRSQIFSNEDIVPSPGSLEVALSSFFVLTLRDHKLVYVKEVSHAPGLAKFKSTAANFLKRSRDAYINQIYEKCKLDYAFGGISERVTKKSLMESIDAPDLKILELPGKGSLGAFIRQFKIISSVQVRMIKPNSEIDNSKLFQKLRVVNQHLDSDVTTITYRNKEGLRKSRVEDELDAALDGNSELVLTGKREDGSKLNGSNKDFTIFVPIDIIPREVRNAARMLTNLLKSLISKGTLSVAKTDGKAENEEKLNELARNIEQ